MPKFDQFFEYGKRKGEDEVGIFHGTIIAETNNAIFFSDQKTGIKVWIKKEWISDLYRNPLGRIGRRDRLHMKLYWARQCGLTGEGASEMSWKLERWWTKIHNHEDIKPVELDWFAKDFWLGAVRAEENPRGKFLLISNRDEILYQDTDINKIIELALGDIEEGDYDAGV